MIHIKKSEVVSSELVKRLDADPRCKFGREVTVEEGASIYLDPAATELIIQDRCHLSRGAHVEVNRGASISLGRNVTVGRNSTIAAMCSVEIGDGVGVANDVSIRDHNHRLNTEQNLVSSEPTPWSSGFEAAPIVVERMAIISDNVRISPGVRIGQNSLVGAGVHVRQTIPPNCRVVGDGSNLRILDTFVAPVEQVRPGEFRFLFFGDSLIDRPSIVTQDPHFDLPRVGKKVEVLDHETAGFYKLVLQRLQITFPEYRFVFEKFAEGGSKIRDVESQIDNALTSNAYWDVSVICVGVNDIWRKYQGRDRDAVLYEEFVSRYGEALKKLTEHSRIVLCIGEPLVSVGENSRYINEELQAYNSGIKQFVNMSWRSTVYFVDLFTPFQRSSTLISAYNPNECLWVDGVHLSPLGNMLAADIIMRCLESEKLSSRLLRLASVERDLAARRYAE